KGKRICKSAEPLGIGISEERAVIRRDLVVVVHVPVFHIANPNAVLRSRTRITIVIHGACAVLDFFYTLEEPFFDVAKEQPGCIADLCALRKVGEKPIRTFTREVARSCREVGYLSLEP